MDGLDVERTLSVGPVSARQVSIVPSLAGEQVHLSVNPNGNVLLPQEAWNTLRQCGAVPNGAPLPNRRGRLTLSQGSIKYRFKIIGTSTVWDYPKNKTTYVLELLQVDSQETV